MRQPPVLKRNKAPLDMLFFAFFVGLHLFFALSSFDWFSGIPMLVVISPRFDWYSRVISGFAVAITCIARRRFSSGRLLYTGLLILGGCILQVLGLILSGNVPFQRFGWLSGLPTLIGVAAAAGAYVNDAQSLFCVSRIKAARLIAIFFFALTIPFQTWSIVTVLGVPRPLRMYPWFALFAFVETVLRFLYPFTVILFVLLMTEWSWLPILLRKQSVRSALGRLLGNLPSKPDAQHGGWSTLPIAITTVLGALVPMYQWFPNRPLGYTSPYYFQVLKHMKTAGLGAAFSTDRPFFFIILYVAQRLFSLQPYALLSFLTVALGAALPIATYAFMRYLNTGRDMAVYAAIFSIFSAHVTVGADYYIVANWLALIPAMAFFISFIKGLRTKSVYWALLAVLLSWCIIGVHYFTWIFLIAVVFVHLCLTALRQRTLKAKDLRLQAEILIGCIAVASLVLLFIYVKGGDLMIGLELATAEVKTFLTNASPANFVSLLTNRDGLLLYFATEHYATPLTYALALIGLTQLHRAEHDWALLLRSWTIASCIGALLIHFDELWRFLYQMPTEILAAIGLMTVFNLLGPSNKLEVHCVNEKTKTLARVALVLTVFLTIGASLALTTLPSLVILTAPCFTFLLELVWPCEEDRSELATVTVASLALGELARALKTLLVTHVA